MRAGSTSAAARRDIENDGRDDLACAWIVTRPGLTALARLIGIGRTPGAIDDAADAHAAYRFAGLTRLSTELAPAEASDHRGWTSVRSCGS